jgi:hypothetical protein
MGFELRASCLLEILYHSTSPGFSRQGLQNYLLELAPN